MTLHPEAEREATVYCDCGAWSGSHCRVLNCQKRTAANAVGADAREFVLVPRKVLKEIALAARTSGGVAGRDEALCAACDAVEAMLSASPQPPSPELNARLRDAVERSQAILAAYIHPPGPYDFARADKAISDLLGVLDAQELVIAMREPPPALPEGEAKPIDLLAAMRKSLAEVEALEAAHREGCLTTQRVGGALKPQCDYPACQCAGIDGREAMVRSLIGTAPQNGEADDKWRDIASAPKDTFIWTLWDGVNNQTGEPARYHTAGCLHSGDEETPDVWLDEHGDYMDEPTHWQLLPAPPAPNASESPTPEGT